MVMIGFVFYDYVEESECNYVVLLFVFFVFIYSWYDGVVLGCLIWIFEEDLVLMDGMLCENIEVLLFYCGMVVNLFLLLVIIDWLIEDVEDWIFFNLVLYLLGFVCLVILYWYFY